METDIFIFFFPLPSPAPAANVPCYPSVYRISRFRDFPIHIQGPCRSALSPCLPKPCQINSLVAMIGSGANQNHVRNEAGSPSVYYVRSIIASVFQVHFLPDPQSTPAGRDSYSLHTSARDSSELRATSSPSAFVPLDQLTPPSV
jgi:hypothetical protein